jgi:hypothetical protein
VTVLCVSEVYQSTTMPNHERESQDEANYYPVNGIRGHCKCGNFFQYIIGEGEVECGECGRVWNVYVDHECWEGPVSDS